MVISKQTLEVLKNFSFYNNGLAVKPGNLLRTVHPQKTVLIEYATEENFDKAFAIYDLNTFLSVLSISGDSPDIDFGDTTMTINSLGGRSKTTYRYCDVEHIEVPPEKSLELNNPDVEFTLEQSDFERIMKFANTLSLPDINFASEGSEICVVVNDLKNDASNVNSLTLGPGNGDKFNIPFKAAHFKFIPGDYEVKVTKDGFAQFKNKKMNLTYWVTVERQSSFYTKA